MATKMEEKESKMATKVEEPEPIVEEPVNKMKLSSLRLIKEDSNDEDDEKDKDIDIPELQISQNAEKLKVSEVSELDLKKITYM
jgi:hypothetical protein